MPLLFFLFLWPFFFFLFPFFFFFFFFFFFISMVPLNAKLYFYYISITHGAVFKPLCVVVAAIFAETRLTQIQLTFYIYTYPPRLTFLRRTLKPYSIMTALYYYYFFPFDPSFPLFTRPYFVQQYFIFFFFIISLKKRLSFFSF